MSAKGTRAIDALRRAGVAHTVHEYATEPPRAARGAGAGGPSRGVGVSYGESAAAALGVDPARVYKTLVAVVDGRLAVGIVPVDGELDLKRFAEALGGRRATMAEPAEAERATGYVVGGISPLGQRRALPAVLDETALGCESVLVSGGRRGLQIELAPGDLARLTGARIGGIARRD